MQAIDRTPDELLARIADLEARLAEAQQTLEAIRKGDVDAIVVGQGGAEQVYTLRGADEPYRMIVEHMKGRSSQRYVGRHHPLRKRASVHLAGCTPETHRRLPPQGIRR